MRWSGYFPLPIELPGRAHAVARLSALVLLPFCLSLSACGIVHNFSARADEKKRERALAKLTESSVRETTNRLGGHALGEVLYVDSSEGFVLVRILAGATVAPGMTLECRRGNARPARLRTTQEYSRPNIAADIVSGEPAVGDAVVAASGASAQRLIPVNDPANLAGPSAATPPATPGSTISQSSGIPSGPQEPVVLPPMNEAPAPAPDPARRIAPRILTGADLDIPESPPPRSGTPSAAPAAPTGSQPSPPPR